MRNFEDNLSVFTDWVPFISPNQQCQSTKEITYLGETLPNRCRGTMYIYIIYWHMAAKGCISRHSKKHTHRAMKCWLCLWN